MSNNDDYIKELIIKNRPKLSQGSINTYMASYRKIKKSSNINVETANDIVDNYQDLLSWMKDTMTPNVRKSKLACLTIIIDDKTNENEEKKNKALQEFRKQMSIDGEIVDKQDSNQELTERQRKNYISQEEVLKIYNELKSQATPLFKIDRLNKNQFNLLQSYVLLSLYTHIAPRRSTDYTAFKIRNFNTSPQSTDNYMFNFNRSKKKPSSFVFNTYKNANRMGRQIIEIPKSLEKIINEWSRFNKSDYLLVNNSGNPITPSKITLWLNQIFGKSISSSMLRHIFLSEKFGDVNLNDLQNTAREMGQSDITQTLKYVQKNDIEVNENKK
jgi:hypothetical protein